MAIFVTPSFPATPPRKVEALSSPSTTHPPPPPFRKFDRFNLPAGGGGEEGGVHTICFYFTLLYSCSLFVWQNDFLSLWKFNIYIHISCLTMFYLFFISNYIQFTFTTKLPWDSKTTGPSCPITFAGSFHLMTLSLFF